VTYSLRAYRGLTAAATRSRARRRPVLLLLQLLLQLLLLTNYMQIVALSERDTLALGLQLGAYSLGSTDSA